jgi:hypothetical protein
MFIVGVPIKDILIMGPSIVGIPIMGMPTMGMPHKGHTQFGRGIVTLNLSQTRANE